MAADRKKPKGGKDAPETQSRISEEKRKRADRREESRRLDERRKYGFGEIIPERRMIARRDAAARRARKRR